jgi:hypothetical protein
MSASRMFIPTVAGLSALIAAGCQSSPAPGPQALEPAQRTIVVSAGNGGATTVALPAADDVHADVLSGAGSQLNPYVINTGNGGTTTIVVPSPGDDSRAAQLASGTVSRVHP